MIDRFNVVSTLLSIRGELFDGQGRASSQVGPTDSGSCFWGGDCVQV